MPWRPGALELLPTCASSGCRCALVTMSYRRFVAPILATLPDGTFEVVVTGDTVTQGKPHPEPYQKAAAILGVDPSDTVAIEDSNTGARSAEAAGCTVLVVENHVPGRCRASAGSSWTPWTGMTAADLPVPGAAAPPDDGRVRGHRAAPLPGQGLRARAPATSATVRVDGLRHDRGLAVVGRRRGSSPSASSPRSPGSGRSSTTRPPACASSYDGRDPSRRSSTRTGPPAR